MPGMCKVNSLLLSISCSILLSLQVGLALEVPKHCLNGTHGPQTYLLEHQLSGTLLGPESKSKWAERILQWCLPCTELTRV